MNVEELILKLQAIDPTLDVGFDDQCSPDGQAHYEAARVEIRIVTDTNVAVVVIA